MTKNELISEVAKRTEYNIGAIRNVLESIEEVAKETLGNGEKISIINVGVFSIVTQSERNGINPQTMEKILIPEKKKLKFKMSSNAMKYFFG